MKYVVNFFYAIWQTLKAIKAESFYYQEEGKHMAAAGYYGWERDQFQTVMLAKMYASLHLTGVPAAEPEQPLEPIEDRATILPLQSNREH